MSRNRTDRPARPQVATAVVVLVALVGSVAGMAPGHGQASPASSAAAPTAVSSLLDEVGAGAQVDVDEAGVVRFLGAPPSVAAAGGTEGGASAATVATAFVTTHGDAFGLGPDADLEVVDTTAMGGGGASIRFQQFEQGVPVLAGELRVQVGSDGAVTSAVSELSQGEAPPVAAVVPAGVARDVALADVGASTAWPESEGDAGHGEQARVDPARLAAAPPILHVYDPVLLGHGEGDRRLVWQVLITGSGDHPTEHEVLVDAATGAVVHRMELTAHALDRRVCDRFVVGPTLNCSTASTPARVEGQGPTGVAEVDEAYDYLGDTYDFFHERFGRDSLDDAGMPLIATVRICTSGDCPYSNASYGGGTMAFGYGWVADDVVAHEMTHGFIGFTSQLRYEYEAGAINESLADVFGELVDLTNGRGDDRSAVRWLGGEDLVRRAVRDMADPPRYGDADRMGSPLYEHNTADNGGIHSNSGVGNKAAALLTDGGSFNGQVVRGVGVDKAARIYHEVATTLLGPTSDYHALGLALPQACRNAVGVDGITAADCDEVAKAVVATEMVPAPPANDGFAAAEVLTGATGSVTGRNRAATTQVGEPDHAGHTGGGSVWYRITAPASGPATIDTAGSSYDTLLGVYRGGSLAALTPVAANDDVGTGTGWTQSRVGFDVVAGTTYRIAVDGKAAARGRLTLNWSLPSGATGVAGTVTGRVTGAPLAGIQVALLRAADFSVAGGGVTNPSGDFTAAAPPGTYFPYLIDPSGTHASAFAGTPPSPVIVGTGLARLDATMASARGTVTGRQVVDGATTTGVARGWAVTLDPRTGRPSAASRGSSGGTYTLTVPHGDHLLAFVDPSGRRAPEFWQDKPSVVGARTLTVAPGSTTTINPLLTAQGFLPLGETLRGTVTDEVTGAPLAGVHVLALRDSDLRVASGSVTTVTGEYGFMAPAGSYRLLFIDSTGLRDPEWHHERPYSDLAGATPVTTSVGVPLEVDATLAPAAGAVAGRVTVHGPGTPVAGAWVLAIGARGIAGGAVAAADGTYRVADLPTGAYRMAFVDPSGQRRLEYWPDQPDFAAAQPVTVTGGGTTTVDAALVPSA